MSFGKECSLKVFVIKKIHLPLFSVVREKYKIKVSLKVLFWCEKQRKKIKKFVRPKKWRWNHEIHFLKALKREKLRYLLIFDI